MTDPVQGCDCILLQTGIPSLDWSEAFKIHKGKASQSHHNSQLWMGAQPWGQLPGQPEVGEGMGGQTPVLQGRVLESDFGGINGMMIT